MSYPNNPTRYSKMILSEVTSGEYVDWLSGIASEATQKAVSDNSKNALAWPGRLGNIGLMHLGLIDDPSLIPMTKSVADLDDVQVYIDKYVRDKKLTKRRGVKTGGKNWRVRTAPDALRLARSFDVLSADELSLPIRTDAIDNYGRPYRSSLNFIDKPFGYKVKEAKVGGSLGFTTIAEDLMIALLEGRLDIDGEDD